MATLAEHSLHSTASPMPTMPASDDQELDCFVNFDQLAYPSADAARLKVASTDFTASVARSANFASSGQSPITFQAPSHHYKEHRQQTGLPPGALSMTYNQKVAHSMRYNGTPAFQVNGEMNTPMKREGAPFDFNTVPTQKPREMDIESDDINSTPYYFYHCSTKSGNKNQYVDPKALRGHELAQAGLSTQVGRIEPGIHQQQAAMAKAARQQKHNEMANHQMQQRRVEEAPTLPNRVSRNLDSVVEERISHLMQQMRANAAAASEVSPSPSSGLPQMAKARKDEVDMDEDERLLNSEEGKKLSTKERRQLRNKVSARAFRSRRKGMYTRMTIIIEYYS